MVLDFFAFVFDEVSQQAKERAAGMCVVLLQTLTSDGRLRYSAHHSRPASGFFLHTPPLNILLWKNPLKRRHPPPLNWLKISCQDHLFTPPPPHVLFCQS